MNETNKPSKVSLSFSNWLGFAGLLTSLAGSMIGWAVYDSTTKERRLVSMEMRQVATDARIEATKTEMVIRLNGMEANVVTRLNSQEKSLDALAEMVSKIVDRELNRLVDRELNRPRNVAAKYKPASSLPSPCDVCGGGF